MNNKMRLRNGEITASQLVLLIILLATTIIVLLVFARFKSNYDATGELTCAAQVREQAFRQKTLPDLALEIDACRTRNVTITRDDYPPGWSTQRVDLAVKKKLADEMFWCWSTWGEGELQLFNKEGWHCSPCATVRFDANITKMYEASGGNIQLGEYLTTNRSPKGITYHEYFSKQSSIALTDIGQEDDFFIQPDKPYVITYMQLQEHTEEDIISKLTPLSNTQSSTILGVLRGAGGAAAIGIVTIVFPPAAGVTAVTAMVSSVVGSGVAGYLYGLRHDDWYTMSAMYIMEDNPQSPDAQFCETLGKTTKSP
jgi:hypothetical protein